AFTNVERSTPAVLEISSNVPLPLLRNIWLGPLSLPTNRSSQPSLSISAHDAVCVEVAALSPLSAVTSPNVPSHLFRNSDLRMGNSQPPRNTRMSMHPSLL